MTFHEWSQRAEQKIRTIVARFPLITGVLALFGALSILAFLAGVMCGCDAHPRVVTYPTAPIVVRDTTIVHDTVTVCHGRGCKRCQGRGC